jgi:hypothetical protein
MDVKGILWHDTGANNKTLKRYVQPSDAKPAEDTYSKTKWLEILGTNGNKNDWNHIERQAGLNCWIGTLADGTVTTVQTMPWDYRPWGCGKGSKGTCNDGWIQFEICQDAKTDRSYFDATYKEACEITAYLCKLYNINPKGTVTHNGVTVPTILCHQDSYRLGLGSNHSDMYDWFNLYGKTMDDVRNDVAALLGGSVITESKKETRYFKIVDPTGMNMRTEPNKTLVQNIPHGTVISGDTFKKVNNIDWVYTTYKGKSGYVAVLPESKGYAVDVTDEYNKPEPTPVQTAVKTYELYADTPIYATASEAKAKTPVKTTYKAGTYYIYNKYPDGVNGILNISSDKTGNSAGGWVNPSENIKPVEQKPVTSTAKTYKVVAVVNRYSTVDDAVNKKNSKGTYDIGTYYLYEKYPDGSKGMFNISTDKTGKSAGSWINPSENVVIQTPPTQTEKPKVEEPKVEEPKAEETPKVEATPKKVYELEFPSKHLICEAVKTDTDYEKKFTQVCESILKNNPSFDVNIVRAFYKIAPLYGIDQIRAISQSILETGWFNYKGSAVVPEHHNYCGLGVTVNGKPGNIFNTIEDGVRAQLQHLYAYGCKDTLPAGENLLDERFKYVTRGIAPTWEELAGRWAVPGFDGSDPEAAIKNGTTYGQKIDKIYNSLLALNVSQETIDKYFTKIEVEPPVEEKPEEPEVKPIEPEQPEVPEQPEPQEPEQVIPEQTKPEEKQEETKQEGSVKEPEKPEIDKAKVNTILDIITKILTYILNFFSKK